MVLAACLCEGVAKADCHVWPNYLAIVDPPDPPLSNDSEMCDDPTPPGVICATIQPPDAEGEACKIRICLYGEEGSQCVRWDCTAIQGFSVGNLDCSESTGNMNIVCAPVGTPHVIACWVTDCNLEWDIDPVDAIKRKLSSLKTGATCWSCDCSGIPVPPLMEPTVSCQSCL
jgi:hypothetical protein